MTKPLESAEPARSDRFPPGIPFIVGNEAAERFSYYGMRSILYLYLVELFLNFTPETQVSAEVVRDAKADALKVQSLFYAGVYASPMVGAILADRLLGKFPVILFVSLLYCAGHGLLALAGRQDLGVYGGLALIALGAGGIKPCVSANVGDQFTSRNSHLVTKIFQIFYFTVNFGSFFATLLIPWIKKYYGSDWAFGVPGILMALATIVFWLGRKRFVKIPPQPGGVLGFLDFVASVFLFLAFAVVLFNFSFELGLSNALMAVLAVGALIAWAVLFAIRQRMEQGKGFLSLVFYSLFHQRQRQPGMGFFDVARERFGREAAEGPPAVLRIMVVFSMISVFWALFDQHSTTWVEQAKHMDLAFNMPRLLQIIMIAATIGLALYGVVWLVLYVSNRPPPRAVSLTVAGVAVVGLLVAVAVHFVQRRWEEIVLEPAQLQTLNPLMVMLIIPLLNFCVYGPLEKRGVPFPPLLRITVGLFLTAASFAAAALLEMRIASLAETGMKVPALWQSVQYVLLTVGEVLVSVTGLEFAYTQAPRTMKSTIMGFWYLTVTVGNLLVAAMSPLIKSLSMDKFFWIFAGLMLAASTVFAVLAYFYKGKTYLQDAAAS